MNMKRLIELFSLKSLSQNHTLVMLLGCAVPLVLLLYLSWSGVIGKSGYLLLLLLCPLMHILMHKGLHSTPSNPDDNKS